MCIGGPVEEDERAVNFIWTTRIWPAYVLPTDLTANVPR
ncbi:hypothetical protein BH24CHL3_BH24CHL3_06870 [soil metagenome]